MIDVQKWIDMAIEYSPKILMALFAWIVGSWIIGYVVNILKSLLSKRGVDETVRPFLTNLTGILLKVALLISIAGVLGIDTTAFAAVIAAMAFAVGMALQGSLGNFAGGVLMLVFKPIKVGELVSAMGYTGVVKEIQAFSTILLTLDNKTIILPNGPLSTSPIENISRAGTIRVDTVFGIGYGDDIDKARTVIQQVIDACPVGLKDQQHDIFVTELGDSSVNFAVRMWVKSEHYWDGYFYLHEEIKKAFDRENIGIPYPTMDLNITKQN
ncbi:MAG: mechanosensitive ion channel domain-containing protein [Bacteroidota bacterium]